jgi:hypothetical protein
MLPGAVLSTSLQKSPFLFPDNVARRTELEDYEMGGIDIQDPSQGLMYQPWFGEIDATTKIATLVPLNSGETPTVIFTETATPVEFSFSFDLNMRYTSVVRFADNTAKLRWYDTALPGYATTTYTGIQSCMLAMDDKRPVNSGQADVIFTYLKTDNRLYFRAQRDRYLVEYPLTTPLAPDLRITNFGMGKNLRLQWRLAVRRVL